MSLPSKKKITKLKAFSIIVFSLMLLYFGVQLLVPYFTPESAYMKINSEVLGQRMTDNICYDDKGGSYHCYALLFRLKETNTEYGFGLGSNLNEATNEATEFSKILLPGKTYTFFIDPKTQDDQGDRLGLNIIKDGNKILYTKDFSPWLGTPLILIGVFFLVFLFVKRKQIV